MNDNLKGILLMLMSMAGFAINDSIIKSIGQSMPLGQLLFVRGLISSMLIVAALKIAGQSFRLPAEAHLWMAIRLLGELVVTFGFLTALMNMPIANATAILQFSPILITFAAIFIFKEVVGWRRWLAIMTGFVGVVIIIRPGYEGFTFYSVLVLAAVAGSVVRDLATRKLPRSVHNLTITSYTSLVITIAGLLVMTIGRDHVALLPGDIIGLGVSSLFLLIGYFGLSAAMRQGDIAVVTPFRYSVFLWAIMLGFFVFDELPDMPTLFGAVLIIASGVVTILRNARRQ